MPDDKQTLKQWMLDMTGPEDAWAREQYAALVIAAKALAADAPLCEGSRNHLLKRVDALRAALRAAGEGKL